MEDKQEDKVYSGRLTDESGNGLSVRMVEAPKAPPKYPFGWGVTTFSPSIFAPRRRPLSLYDLLLVGLPVMQGRLLAYLIRRQVAERLLGRTAIPMPPWSDVAWELGTNAKAARLAFAALERLHIAVEVQKRPRQVQVSPYLHFVGTLALLHAHWRDWLAFWTPEQTVWEEFWNSGPSKAQVTQIAKEATQTAEEAGDDLDP